MRKSLRQAFTLLEMVFVIVIVGILSKFGVELFLQTYQGYNRSLVYNTLSAKVENAALSIANRLNYRIRDSIIVNGATALSSANGAFNRIEWIDRNMDNWLQGNYSGVIDLSTLAPFGNNVLFSPRTASLPANGALMFIGTDVDVLTSFGWQGQADMDLYRYDPIVINGQITFNTYPIPSQTRIFEFFIVADSATGVQLNGDELTLSTGYRPWYGETIGDVTASTLMDNVSTFTVQKIGDILKLNICLSEANFLGEGDYSICKTKLVL